MYYICKRHIFFFFKSTRWNKFSFDPSTGNFSFVCQVYCTTSGMPFQFVVLMSYFKLLSKSLLKYLMSTVLMLSASCCQNQPRCVQAFFFISNDDEHLLCFQISTQFNSFFFVFKTLKNWRIVISVWRQRKLYLEIENQT